MTFPSNKYFYLVKNMRMDTPDKMFIANLEDTEILFEHAGDGESVRSGENPDGAEQNVPDITYLPI